MFPEVRAEVERAGVPVPREGVFTIYHAGPAAKLDAIEATLEIPGAEDGDGKFRVYAATSPQIAEVVPHADGAVAIDVDVELPLELGMGQSQEWVELVYEVPSGNTGMPVVRAWRVT